MPEEIAEQKQSRQIEFPQNDVDKAKIKKRWHENLENESVIGLQKSIAINCLWPIRNET
jgi:hypothetical protein